MKSQCRSIDLNLWKSSHEHQQKAQVKDPLHDLRPVLSDRQRSKKAVSQLEMERHDDLLPGTAIKPANRVRQARQSDVSSVVPPVCHVKHLEQSNSLVSTSFVREVEAKKKRLRLDQPRKMVDTTLRDACKFDDWVEDEALVVPNQSQLNKLFRMKLEAAKFLQQLVASKESIDTVNNARNRLQLMQYMARVLRTMCGESTTPKSNNMSNQQSQQLDFAKANNELLTNSLSKTKELLQKTRKEWSEVCEKLSQRDMQLQKAQEQLFRWQRLYQEEKIKRNSRKSSEKQLSVTVKQMKVCVEMNLKEKHDLLNLIEEKSTTIEQLLNQRSEHNAEIERLVTELEGLKQKPSWVDHYRQNIVRLYEEHLLLLAKDREKYSIVFREFEQFIKQSEGKTNGFGGTDPLLVHQHPQIPSFTSTSIQYNHPLHTSRPRSTECNLNSHNQSLTSYKPASVHFGKSAVTANPAGLAQHEVVKIEEKYRQKLEAYVSQNQELKEQLSKLTDRCVQFGMLNSLVPVKSPKREFAKIPLSPKYAKKVHDAQSPNNQQNETPKPNNFETFRKTQ